MKQWIFVCLFTLFASVAMSQTKGKVVAVADGDTFTLLTDDKKQVKVRLHGIDCPEKKQAFGERAKQFTSSLVFQKKVTVKVKSKDRYKRTVGIVYVDGKCLNEELLKNGYAWHYRQYDKNPEWKRMETEARAAKLGLWQDKNPQAPWEFRKSKKAPAKSAKSTATKQTVLQS